MAAILARGVCKSYEHGRIRALDHLDLDVATGELVAVMGPSGCGKSTLLALLGALDRPDRGTLSVAGQELHSLRDPDDYRARRVGFVFQAFHLLPTLTALENVLVPAVTGSTSERRARALELLRRVGLHDRARARPPQLSGGERQRIAIARALVNRPALLLADEPTGNLDSATGHAIMALLREVQRAEASTVVLVTHDPATAAFADRVVRMRDGRVVTD